MVRRAGGQAGTRPYVICVILLYRLFRCGWTLPVPSHMCDLAVDGPSQCHYT